MTTPASDGWSALAEPYEDVIVPRLQPLYDAMAMYAIDHLRNESHSGEPSKVLDFGTGMAEVTMNGPSVMLYFVPRTW